MYVDGNMRVCEESQRAALHPPSHKKKPQRLDGEEGSRGGGKVGSGSLRAWWSSLG